MPRVFRMSNVPTVDVYAVVLESMRPRLVNDDHIRMFQAQYYAPDRTATASEIARWGSIKNHRLVNLRYGRLGYQFADEAGIVIEVAEGGTNRFVGWEVWSIGWADGSRFYWQMLPQVAEALERLGWVDPVVLSTRDEAFAPSPLTEGRPCPTSSITYERNPEARRRCIERYGAVCCVCGFDSERVYGVGRVIHVHHLRPLSEMGREYVVDPIQDLRPVCPNCHAIIHLGGRCRSIEEVRGMLERANSIRELVE